MPVLYVVRMEGAIRVDVSHRVSRPPDRTIFTIDFFVNVVKLFVETNDDDIPWGGGVLLI